MIGGPPGGVGRGWPPGRSLNQGELYAIMHAFDAVETVKTSDPKVLATIRPTVFACSRKFLVAGTLELTYDVAGNGTVQSVQVGPAFAGTPTGTCNRTATIRTTEAT